ncbi:hypothetical protein J6590_028906 [Homalodisca vitripennis]|nr:hypothetical protein J6590_028906 [Homalodisca vitripennis]
MFLHFLVKIDPTVPSTSGQSTSHTSNNEEHYDSDGSIDDIQRQLDDSSGSSVCSDDADEPIQCPSWSISTMGMRQIGIVKTDSLLVSIPGVGSPLDFFNLLLDVVFLESVCKYTMLMHSMMCTLRII